MKILFVCNQGEDRSRTAKELWEKSHPDDEVKYMGIFNPKHSKELLYWADKIYIMEQMQEAEIKKIDSGLFPKCKILFVENKYYYNSEELVKLLKSKFRDL